MTLINILIIYLLIIQPIIEIKKELLIESKLNIEREHIKKIFLEKKKELKKFKEKSEVLILEKSIKKNEEKDFIFEGETDAFQFIKKISEDNNIEINLLGRELKKLVEGGNKENIYFFYGTGKELDIYNFLFQIENEKKYISIKPNDLLIEINGDVIDLKTNIMYINNNKKEILDYDYYNNEMFRKIKSRDLRKKRRVI